MLQVLFATCGHKVDCSGLDQDNPGASGKSTGTLVTLCR